MNRIESNQNDTAACEDVMDDVFPISDANNENELDTNNSTVVEDLVETGEKILEESETDEIGMSQSPPIKNLSVPSFLLPRRS